ncbi:DUF2508 family protein [Gorillibacterium sp. sgz500922]|uniref:DUF2508 family protein n=1 Tax=Gorillibacterium sp. sgz500922 TaxID=3446694 RepID=UPI003F66E5A6
MGWGNRGDRRDPGRLPEEQEYLLREIRRAHEQWVTASEHLNWVGISEEIDYAVFAMAAAEKKYDILLKQAKKLDWQEYSFYAG